MLEVPEFIVNSLSNLPRTEPLYYENQYVREFEAKVLKTILFKDLLYIVLDRTCFFPEGGGQPGDRGQLLTASERLDVVDTQSIDDVIVHISTSNIKKPIKAENIRGSIYWDLRYDRMKHHTGSHILFSSIRKVLQLDGLMYMGVSINEDISRIDINYGKPIPRTKLLEIERISNEVCLENRDVKIDVTDREEAERIYGNRLGVTETTPSGLVRVVEVSNWDVALCSGTHVKSTNEIGLINILDRFRLKKGVERIEFTVGKNAYQRYIEAMEKLNDSAQILETSTSEVPSRLENLLREREDLKKELRSAKEQFVEMQASHLLEEAELIGALRIVKKRFSAVDAQTLKRIASSLTENEPDLIVFLGSIIGNKVTIVGAAGHRAVEEGINMRESIMEAANIIQGGGGGSAKIAQAGGRLPSKLDEALHICTSRITSVHKFINGKTANWRK